MKHLFILATLATLGACAADRSAAPVILHSAKQPEIVADCIQGRWLTAVPYPSIKARNGEGYTVQLHADGVGPMVIADAMPEGGGTAVNLRSWAFGDWRLEELTRACL